MMPGGTAVLRDEEEEEKYVSHSGTNTTVICVFGNM